MNDKPKSRRWIAIFLAVYFLFISAAALMRIDHFPLTWAPMYSMVVDTPSFNVTVLDRHQVHDIGYEVVHRDGTRSTISYRDLNIPFRNFWQIYEQRTVGIGPFKHRRKIDDMGVAHEIEVDWPTRVFQMLNNTFSYKPTDDKFIVEVTARRRIAHFEDMRSKPRFVGPLVTSDVTLRWVNDHGEMFFAEPPPRVEE